MTPESFARFLLDTPLLADFLARLDPEEHRRMIESTIQARHSKLPKSARDRLRRLMEEGKLDGLYRLAILCPTREAFVEHLKQLDTAPAPPPSRRSRKR